MADEKVSTSDKIQTAIFHNIMTIFNTTLTTLTTVKVFLSIVLSNQNGELIGRGLSDKAYICNPCTFTPSIIIYIYKKTSLF